MSEHSPDVSWDSDEFEKELSDLISGDLALRPEPTATVDLLPDEPEQISAVHELDFRKNDGISVTLFWDRSENRTYVSVNDGKTGESFEIDVRKDMDAYDVFHHPYAYATRYAKKTGLVALEGFQHPNDEQDAA
jgi:hypothetical protein